MIDFDLPEVDALTALLFRRCSCSGMLSPQHVATGGRAPPSRLSSRCHMGSQRSRCCRCRAVVVSACLRRCSNLRDSRCGARTAIVVIIHVPEQLH